MLALLCFVDCRGFQWALVVSFTHFRDDICTVARIQLAIKSHYSLETLDQLNRLTVAITWPQGESGMNRAYTAAAQVNGAVRRHQGYTGRLPVQA
jgi:hypothetical protein